MEDIARSLDALAAALDESLEDVRRRVVALIEEDTERALRAGKVRPRRVAHDLDEKEVDVESWADDKGRPLEAARKVKQLVRRNKRDDCPDCGRGLISAMDADLPRGVAHLLVCPRVHGMKATLDGLTDHDIIACGVTN